MADYRELCDDVQRYISEGGVGVAVAVLGTAYAISFIYGGVKNAKIRAQMTSTLKDYESQNENDPEFIKASKFKMDSITLDKPKGEAHPRISAKNVKKDVVVTKAVQFSLDGKKISKFYSGYTEDYAPSMKTTAQGNVATMNPDPHDILVADLDSSLKKHSEYYRLAFSLRMKLIIEEMHSELLKKLNKS